MLVLLSFLIDCNGSLVREASAPSRLHDAAPVAAAFEITGLALDMDPAFGGTAVFYASVVNRSDAVHAGVFTATLSDAAGSSLAGRALQNGWRLEAGAETRVAFAFALPGDYIPHRLVLRPIRVTLE